MVTQSRGGGGAMRFRNALSDAAIREAKAESTDLKLADGGGLFLLVANHASARIPSSQPNAERPQASD
ncbi:hypothetical protein ABIF79_003274 [Bradyrhizobium japonicum]